MAFKCNVKCKLPQYIQENMNLQSSFLSRAQKKMGQRMKPTWQSYAGLQEGFNALSFVLKDKLTL